MSIREEIIQQPDVIQNILDHQWENIKQVASKIRQEDINYVFLAARGTSDHAGIYAKYLFGMQNRIPVALAAPSLFSIYGSSPKIEKSLILAISQSGQSPDIVSVLESGNQQGLPTLAITNEVNSPLAKASKFVLDISAGEEKAVAATKTYTAQLMTIALLSIALSEDWQKLEEIRKLPEMLSATLKLESIVERAVEQYYYMKRCVIIGRGFNYATAFEWALKMKELAYLVAEPYSSADFLHGPIAMVEQGFPVFMVATSGSVYSKLRDLAIELKEEKKANLMIISDQEEILKYSSAPLKLERDLPEWLSPLVSIIPAQLFCMYLAKFKNFDINNPRGLSKVTKTI